MKAQLIQSFYIFITAMFAALIMMPFLMRWALDKGIVDVPGGRKKHSTSTPRLGGIAIGMAFLFTILVFVDMTREIRGILAGVMILFFTGLVDDLVGIPVHRKFIGELIGATVTIFVGNLTISNLGNLFGSGDIILPIWLGIPLTVVALVGMVNALNLIDGLDGLAGGVSVIALAAFSLLGLDYGNLQVMIVGVGLLGALLGFLNYNFYPARIFMGDTGSLVVGFVLACIAIQLTQHPGSHISPMTPVIILGIPIFDTLRVMVRRVMQGQSPFVADRTHIHHKLLSLGLEHRFTVITIYGISLFWAFIGVLCRSCEDCMLLPAYVSVSVLFFLGIRILRRNHTRFAFFAHASNQGLRETALYNRVSQAIVITTPLILVAILFFFSSAIFVSIHHQMSPVGFTAALIAAIVGMAVLTNDLINPCMQSLLHGMGMLAAFVIRMNPQDKFFGTVCVGEFSDTILVGLALLVALRLLFRHKGDFCLTNIDYLFLGICIFLSIVSPLLKEVGPISGTLCRGVVVFMGLKSLEIREKIISWSVVSTVMMLLLILINGIWKK
jgi:UDP-GlcNAc:undecaprenyl-phosphate GlcNAc-1-phosphate transferase